MVFPGFALLLFSHMLKSFLGRFQVHQLGCWKLKPQRSYVTAYGVVWKTSCCSMAQPFETDQGNASCQTCGWLCNLQSRLCVCFWVSGETSSDKIMKYFIAWDSFEATTTIV